VIKLNKKDVDTLNECISKDVTRFSLQGWYFDSFKNKLRVTGTDGKRLVRMTYKTGKENQKIVKAFKDKIITPVKIKSSEELILSEVKGIPKFTIKNTKDLTEAKMTPREIEGKFPNVDAVFPKEDQNMYTFGINVSLFPRESVRVRLSKEKGPAVLKPSHIFRYTLVQSIYIFLV